ncbi:MAG: FAD-dependent oxidoreductase [Planctomycetota bacterium]
MPTTQAGSDGTVFPTDVHEVDVCVIGGGMAGVCAALASAREGAETVLMQDRPVLGGNSSSECRVHICGADRHGHIPNMRETGILEELRLQNLHRNPNQKWSLWDGVLYDTCRRQENLSLLLNCSCLDASTKDRKIRSITGWQLTTEKYQTVTADIFIDCSGDAVLAPLTGADWRMGREGRDEYDESIAPEEPDRATMGMSVLFWAEETESPQPFTAPSWAKTFKNCEDLPYGAEGHQNFRAGYWWIELGGQPDEDPIADTEEIRDRLLSIAYGVWDHIKNHCDVDADNWTLRRMPMLPAKRESRRYRGDHVLTQNDVEAGGPFEDTVAYGGWSMDDHHPTGFWSARLGHKATIFHHAPSPYGIPYRSLYSRNIDNLMFAGRCASCTHAAMSSTRVMGTGSVMGQAAGTAAAIAVAASTTPRGVYEQHLQQLQQSLLADDCYLPGIERELPDLTRHMKLRASSGNPEPVRDGITRPAGEQRHGWPCRPGETISYRFPDQRRISTVDLTLESELDRLICMCPKDDDRLRGIPASMPEAFEVEVLREGEWQQAAAVEDNIHRHVRLPTNQTGEGVRFRLRSTHGADTSCVYRFEVR